MKPRCREYNSLDVLKFLLSIFVLVIHSEIDKTVLSPLLRVAVPTFFIISSYLFFSKLEGIPNKRERHKALKHLVKRNVYLYIAWTIIQLPMLIYGKHYHTAFFENGIWYTLRDVLLGNSFTGSWYIIALALGTPILYMLSRKMHPRCLLLLTLPIYVLCCFASNYRGSLPENSGLDSFFAVYKQVTMCDFNTSLPGALFWIALGKFLAAEKEAIQNRKLYLALIISVALIAVERVFIVQCHLQYHDDCYFSLVLLCPSLFLLVKQNSITFHSKFRFREISTLIYVIHGSCGRITGFALKQMPQYFRSNEPIKVMITLAASIVISVAVLYLRDKSKWKVLKFIC